jgi:hypothetical protein
MRIPAIYILLLLAAAVVLAFALEFRAAYRDAMRSLAAPSGEEPSNRKPDPRLLVLAIIGGLAALAAAAAVIVGSSLDPRQTERLLAWPLDHPSSWLLPAGVVLCLVALVCGVKRQPVWLFCLTLPGLVIMPLMLLPHVMKSDKLAEAFLIYSFVFALQPGVWILLSIGVGQARLLRKPGGNFTPGGLVRLALISLAYFYGFFP